MPLPQSLEARAALAHDIGGALKSVGIRIEWNALVAAAFIVIVVDGVRCALVFSAM